MAWYEHYDLIFKNCAMAAFALQKPFPKRGALAIRITHKQDQTLPVQHRFELGDVRAYGPGELSSVRDVDHLDLILDAHAGPSIQAYKNDTHGVLMVVVTGDLNGRIWTYMKPLGVPKLSTVLTRNPKENWVELLREYVAKGARVSGRTPVPKRSFL